MKSHPTLAPVWSVALLPLACRRYAPVYFEKSVKVGTTVKKGDMLGYFLFGGSDFVLLFQNKVNFTLTAPKESRDSYKHILMGEEYGRLTMRK